jgi:hypothetical protein
MIEKSQLSEKSITEIMEANQYSKNSKTGIS